MSTTSTPNSRSGTEISPPAQRFIVGSDHAALGAKRVVVEQLRSLGHEAEDIGPHDEASVDYPDYARKVCDAVVSGTATFGILLCGTGIGMSIAANKIAGIRAALVHDVTGARLSREHNDANVLVLGGGVLGDRLLRDIIDAWTAARFEGGRHQRRLDKIHALEPAAAASGKNVGRGSTSEDSAQ